MIDIANDIHSLTEFKRNTGELVRRLKETGHPLVLTVNGRAELVVQDAASYQQLLDELDRAEAIAGIKRGLEEMRRGEGIALDEAFDELRRKHGIPR